MGFSSEANRVGFSSEGFSSEFALEASAPKALDHGAEGVSTERSRTQGFSSEGFDYIIA